MTEQTWESVDGYLSELLVPADPALEQALVDSREAGLPEIAVAPNQGRMLELLARMCGARRILEIGTLGGYSTIWLGRALPADGSLVTLEYEPKHAQVARANIARAGLADKVEVRVGAALDTLPALVGEGAGPFDLVFIDADKDNYPGYLDWSVRLSRPGTVIVADNVIRDGKVVEPNHADPRVRGVREFLARVAANPRLSATAVQTVGTKGYDGFALAIVTG
ncbi:O-methyltransferase [Actinocatenispora rupis]|uniref:O-methyltransferase n=1 Tax=Actinocatenispora rupis TaxID=519421 RepID=A0A8J3J3Z6_9ACTN|nr:O-methyltransferase [Actinocatenispora rupis]GID09717.1 O-methyltransferase [Actinocatenispora rupis]